jgi:hypothetical protein
MSLDEELIARNGQSNEEADNSESDAPDSDISGKSSSSKAAAFQAAKQESRNGVEPESQNDLLADKVAKGRLQKTKDKAKQAIAVAVSPAKQALSGALKASWENLIDSFGLTLIWIDIHYIASFVFGKDLFCDLGEEWIPAKIGVASSDKK